MARVARAHAEALVKEPGEMDQVVEAAAKGDVPTFVAARCSVVGAQPYETLAQLLDKAGAVRRS
jgi:predicted DsbA family dithiol-disulfide isomerase